MLVYMLLNTVTERCYIGATDGTLAERWTRHLKEASPTSRLGRALVAWPSELWVQVVLCNCYSVDELAAAERAWQLECCAFDDAVGYNDRRGEYETSIKAGRRGGDPLVAEVKATSPLAGLNPEERREYFREAGRRGAIKSRSLSR